jgi:ribosomal subunit interface protein
MRVDLTGRHVEISPGLRRLVERKLQKVHRQVNNAGVSATVVVTKERINNVVELTLHARGEQFMHAVAKASAWETAMTDVVGKVLHQLEKTKGIWQERKRRGPAARSVKTPRPARRAQARVSSPVTAEAALLDLIEAPPERPAARPAHAAKVRPKRRVVRAHRYSLKPMTVDQAALELEAQKKNKFLVFRDAGTDAVSVLYRRDDGQFALIEPEA